MLDGKELEGKIGADGKYSVDVNDAGQIQGDVSYEKSFEDGAIKVSGGLSIKIEAMPMLKKLASKIPLLGAIFK